MRSTFAEIMYEELAANPKSCLFLGDIGVHANSRSLSDFPGRAMNLGILEQCMVGVAAGMASEGYHPTIHTIAPFLVERALEQIKIDFGYQRLPGNLVTVGGSLDYSELGPTHHCPSDILILLGIPGAQIFIPGHSRELVHYFATHGRSTKLNYFRLSEQSNSIAQLPESSGQVVTVKSGSLALILAIGPTLDMTLEAAKGLDVQVLYTSSLNPFDFPGVAANLSSGKLLVVEPFFVGSTSVLFTDLIRHRPLKIDFFGLPRKFHTNYGRVHQHYDSLRFTSKDLRNRIEKLILD